MGIPGYDAWKTRSDIDQWYMDHPGEEPNPPMESDELELVYADLKEATATIERLKVAAREAEVVIGRLINWVWGNDWGDPPIDHPVIAARTVLALLREAMR